MVTWTRFTSNDTEIGSESSSKRTSQLKCKSWQPLDDFFLRNLFENIFRPRRHMTPHRIYAILVYISWPS